MLCRADSFLDELSPIQTPFLIASLRRSWTRANSPMFLIRSGGERQQGEEGRGPWSLPAGHPAASLCAPCQAWRVLCTISPSSSGYKGAPGSKGSSEGRSQAGQPSQQLLPGQEGIHAANVMISAQEGDEGWSVKLSLTAVSRPGKTDGSSLLPWGCAGHRLVLQRDELKELGKGRSGLLGK